MITETVFWSGRRGTCTVRCAAVAGCGGVDVQVIEDNVTIRRERYADRSTAYERARALRDEFEQRGYTIHSGNRRA
jgi:hypothetical protein